MLQLFTWDNVWSKATPDIRIRNIDITTDRNFYELDINFMHECQQYETKYKSEERKNKKNAKRAKDKKNSVSNCDGRKPEVDKIFESDFENSESEE